MEAYDRDSTRALIDAANGGDVSAMTEVGRRLLVGRGAPKAPDKGAAMILAAADRGGTDAMALSAVILAAGIVAPPDWSAAISQLRRAALRRHAGAAAQLAVLSGADGQIDLDAWLTPPAPEVVSTAPRLWWLRDFIPPALCDWLVERVKGRLELATVYDPEGGGLDAKEARTNTLFEFNLAEGDLVVMLARARIARALGVRPRQLESSNVLHYSVGQKFSRHFDFLDPAAPLLAEELRARGQRVATALIYLNDGFEGGQTEFPVLGQQLQGRPGDALLFWNVDPAGAPDRSTLHAGLAPTAGEKWLFSQFVRDRDLV